MFTAFSAGYKAVKTASEQSEFITSLKNAFEELMKDETIKEMFKNYPVNQSYSKIKIAENSMRLTIDIPFILYYLLMSFTTKAVYTVPYNGKIVESSNGQSGWDTKHGLAGL
jgi:hypothetical protein